MTVSILTRAPARVGHRRSIVACADDVRRAVLRRARRAARAGNVDIARALLVECDDLTPPRRTFSASPPSPTATLRSPTATLPRPARFGTDRRPAIPATRRPSRT